MAASLFMAPRRRAITPPLAVLYINNEEVEYKVSLTSDGYYLTYSIKSTSLTTLYTPKFIYDGQTISIDGYSFKTLASYYLSNLSSNSLVKQYKNCLTEIANS